MRASPAPSMKAGTLRKGSAALRKILPASGAETERQRGADDGERAAWADARADAVEVALKGAGVGEAGVRGVGA